VPPPAWAGSGEEPGLAEAIDEFQTQLSRTASWLNALPIDRIDRHANGPSIAVQVHRLSTSLLQLQLDLVPDSYPDFPVPELPTVRPHALGSQLLVIGTELLRTIDSASQSDQRGAENLVSFARELVALRSR